MFRFGMLMGDLPNDGCEAPVDVDEMEFRGDKWERTDGVFKVMAPRYVDERGAMRKFTLLKGAFVACEACGAREWHMPIAWSENSVMYTR